MKKILVLACLLLQNVNIQCDSSLPQLRRLSNSDRPLERAAARISLSQYYRESNLLNQASPWVQEYSELTPENIKWPLVQGFIEYALVQSSKGEDFDALQRLNYILENQRGISKILALRALSVISEHNLDVGKAYDYENNALKHGLMFYKREKISDTAGLEPKKPGADKWDIVKTEIETRLQDLKRKKDIEAFGLDYVLYAEAQAFRRASHQLALDFTDIGTAFGLKPSKTPLVDADFEKARDTYQQIIEQFPEGVYAEASRLYSAITFVHTGEPDKALRDLSSFYKEHPEGLYRGEGLKFMGDIYLMNKWDLKNAKEAYTRVLQWCRMIKESKRILDSYAVPEKSSAVSKPPEKIRVMNQYGVVTIKELKGAKIINRMTAPWYLQHLEHEALWKLGFIAIHQRDFNMAKNYLSKVLNTDPMLKRAKENKFFNPYDRIMLSEENGALLGVEADLEGLRGKAFLAMEWADFTFMLEQYDYANSLYLRIQESANMTGDKKAFVRASLGEMLIQTVNGGTDLRDLRRFYSIALENPKAPATPYLLFQCALTADGDPEPYERLFEQVYENYPNTVWALEAWANQVLRLAWIDHEQRHAYMDEFFKRYPNEKEYHEWFKDHDESIMMILDAREKGIPIQSLIEKQ